MVFSTQSHPFKIDMILLIFCVWICMIFLFFLPIAEIHKNIANQIIISNKWSFWLERDIISPVISFERVVFVNIYPPKIYVRICIKTYKIRDVNDLNDIYYKKINECLWHDVKILLLSYTRNVHFVDIIFKLFIYLYFNYWMS